ncbi:DUF2157 domain-containing protein [Bosea sp. TWI1241]|uniref:DUF2157 domain-containing protein n=1 Tax=Bosea sp. TWI1241 TaxID=3148904 RepID=UPI0032078DD0
MLTGSYRKRLDADLTRWVAEGLLSPESASALRNSVPRDGGARIPALLGLFGGLLIAASVSAFVAANWELIPRLTKLVFIILALLGVIGIGARLERSGARGGAEAAYTCAVLVFGAGVALVGQMYHLPSDWPGGALLVGFGALVAAILLRSSGALVIAIAALCAWTVGRWDEAGGQLPSLFWAFFLPILWLSATRSSRLVHHAAVLALIMWFCLLPERWVLHRFEYGLIAYGLALSVAFVAIGSLALSRGGPRLFSAFLPWGLVGLVLTLGVELVRILDAHEARGAMAIWHSYVGYALALPAVAALVLTVRSRRFAWPLTAALVAALLVPVVFWSGSAATLAGKVVVAGLVLSTAIGLVVAGAGGGMRHFSIAGSLLFFVSVMVLLWQTIGTLLDQSLFFLVAGALLIGLAVASRRLFARLSPRQEAVS